MPAPKKFDRGVALKMRMQGQTYEAIGKQLGVAQESVVCAIAPILKQLSDPTVLKEYRDNQAAIFDGLAAKTVASITSDDLEKASFQQKIVGVGILTDKSRLIRGESTANVSMISRMLYECPDLPEQVARSVNSSVADTTD